jgi:DNA-binding XRE family transcriptional regulator
MQARTKKHRTEEVRFTGRPSAIARLREVARELGATETTTDDLTIEEVFPELLTNRAGVSLRGLRYREDISQRRLSELTDIPQRHLSEMENGKRVIGKETARKLADALHADYRVFL